MWRNRTLLICLCLTLPLLITGTVFGQDAQSEEQETYIIQPGDTLLSIARRYNTTVRALVQENNIANPELIYWGQRIRIPSAQPTAEATQEIMVTQAAPTPEPTIPSEAAPEPALPTETEAPPELILAETENNEPITEFGYGIEADLLVDDPQAAANALNSLGVNWVKQVVYWRDLEPAQDQIDFDVLDRVIDTLASQNVQILLTVTAAPDWSRSVQEEDGPPDDFASFANFLSALATRYQGRVAAYQIWNEPNLRNRWRSGIHPISPASYMDLLRQSFEAINMADPGAMIVSAGLAVTGFNDALNAEADAPVNAVDDRVFLQGLYSEGLAEFSDAVGVHPIGWANPPDSRCCEPAPGVETHYENPAFYFLHTLDDYRQIQVSNGDPTTPLWITRFAWGSSEDIGQADAANIFTTYTSLTEQAVYTVRAYELGSQLGYVGPMFAYNLNGCQTTAKEGFSPCYYSFIAPDGAPRPVFQAIQAIDKGIAPALPPAEQSIATPAPELERTAEVTAEIGP